MRTEHAAPLVAAASVACAPVAGRGDDLGPAFRLVGAVGDDVAVSGTETRGYVAWAWLVDGQVDGVAVEVPFEPRVRAYALDVPPPPAADDGQGPAPSARGVDGVALLAGLPVLVEPARGREPGVAVAPDRVWDWVLGETPGAEGAVEVDGGAWAAWSPDHVLLLTAAPGEGARLATHPAWTEDGPLCRLDGAVLGLTPYRDRGAGCAGWEPLAAPGSRTEFQGIDLSAP